MVGEARIVVRDVCEGKDRKDNPSDQGNTWTNFEIVLSAEFSRRKKKSLRMAVPYRVLRQCPWGKQVSQQRDVSLSTASRYVAISISLRVAWPR